PLRRLLPLGSGLMHQAELAFLDNQRKTQCRAFFHFLFHPQGECTTIARLCALKGYEAALVQLRDHMLSIGSQPLDGGNVYAKLFPGTASYDAKPEILITNEDSAFEAATLIISTLLPIARSNERGIIADYDTEFLHD